MPLPTALATAVSSRDCAIGFLIRFDFLTQTSFVWTGFGTLITSDGARWLGLGELISIDAVGGAFSGQASSGSLTLSGVSPTLLPTAINQTSEYKQRPVAIFFQAFNADRSLIGAPCPLALRIMTSMSIGRTGDTRSLTVNHESPYVGRNNPANGWYSDRDQQRRFPGDRACERTAFLPFKQERWPSY